MTYEIKLTVLVTTQVSLAEATVLVQQALEAEQRTTGIMLLTIDKAAKQGVK